MLLFFPLSLLFLVLAVLGFILRYRADFRSFWLVNLSGPMLAWLSLLFLWAELPIQLSMTYWHLSGGPNLNLLWLMDARSWALFFGVASLLLASCLNNVRDLADRRLSAWLPGIVVVASSMLTIIAGNLLTLLITWMLLDLLLLILQFTRSETPISLREEMYSFTANLSGSLILIWAMAANNASLAVPINLLPEETHLLLILAAGLRLGVLPLNPFVLERSEPFKNAPVHISLAKVAAGLALLIKIEAPLANYAFLLTSLALLSALYGSVKYLLANSALVARPYWVLAVGSIVVAAAINGQSAAALAWALVLILGGAFQFLLHPNRANRWIVILWGILVFAALPFGPNFAGAALFTASGNFLSYAFFLPVSLLLLAWVRRANTPSAEDVILERWETALYRSGLILIVLSHLALGLGLARTLSSTGTLLSAWSSLAVISLAAAIWFISSRPFKLTPNQYAFVEQIFSLRWVYQIGGEILRQVASLLRFAGASLEGRAGVLWTLLLVALLLSLISQLNPT